MPSISMFYGIIIYMYFFDNKKHHKPHVHAQYAEHKASFQLKMENFLMVHCLRSN